MKTWTTKVQGGAALVAERASIRSRCHEREGLNAGASSYVAHSVMRSQITSHFPPSRYTHGLF